MLVAVLAIACDGPTVPSAHVEFRTDRSSYAVADTLWLTVTNHGPEPIYSSDLLHCVLGAERRIEDRWEHASTPGTILCKGLHNLEPGEQAVRWILAAPEHFEPGEYRLRTEYAVDRQPPGVQLLSNPFTVQDPD